MLKHTITHTHCTLLTTRYLTQLVQQWPFLAVFVMCCCLRVLLQYRYDSVQGADENMTQILMLKLYKEYPDSAFAVWQQQQVPDVAALVAAPGVAATVATAAAGEGGQMSAAADSSDKAKEVLKAVLANRKQVGLSRAN